MSKLNVNCVLLAAEQRLQEAIKPALEAYMRELGVQITSIDVQCFEDDPLEVLQIETNFSCVQE